MGGRVASTHGPAGRLHRDAHVAGGHAGHGRRWRDERPDQSPRPRVGDQRVAVEFVRRRSDPDQPDAIELDPGVLLRDVAADPAHMAIVCPGVDTDLFLLAATSRNPVPRGSPQLCRVRRPPATQIGV